MEPRQMWGALGDGALDRIVVLSPHFDDAALGASYLLSSHPGSTVLTVMGGWPEAYPDPVSDWDAAGGFRTGDDVVAVRREEDRAAMAVLDAEPVWLEFVDHQYVPPEKRAAPSEVAVELGKAVRDAGPTAVFAPMGLANPDHAVVHAAALLVREELGTGEGAPLWFAYEDAGYSNLPGLLAWRVSGLFRRGLWPTPAVVPAVPDMGRKREAIACYVSQTGPLERDHLLTERLAAGTAEQYWRLEPPPSGWERLTTIDDLDAG